MIILNRNTGIAQECGNKDAINVCRKDTQNYVVAADRKELEQGAADVSGKDPEDPEENARKATKLENPEDNAGTNLEETSGINTGKMSPEELNSQNVKNLQAIAKGMGIQGYSNMDKNTLVAVIMNH